MPCLIWPRRTLSKPLSLSGSSIDIRVEKKHDACDLSCDCEFEMLISSNHMAIAWRFAEITYYELGNCVDSLSFERRCPLAISFNLSTMN